MRRRVQSLLYLWSVEVMSRDVKEGQKYVLGTLFSVVFLTAK